MYDLHPSNSRAELYAAVHVIRILRIRQQRTCSGAMNRELSLIQCWLISDKFLPEVNSHALFTDAVNAIPPTTFSARNAVSQRRGELRDTVHAAYWATRRRCRQVTVGTVTI